MSGHEEATNPPSNGQSPSGRNLDDHSGHVHEHDHPEETGLWHRIRHIYQPHSHDAAESMDTALESSSRGVRAVKVSLIALLVTAILQVFVVVLTGSVALLADTIHNFSDALTSIPLWIAFVVGRRSSTRSFTFGYRRGEDLAGLFIVLMIALSAFLAGWESIQRLVNPREVQNLGLLAAAGFIGFLGNELVAIYRIRIGRSIGSAALIADGQHARTDGLTSLAVLVGAAGSWMGYPIADPIVGLAITLAILFVLKDATTRVVKRLLDGVEPELVDHIESVAEGVEGVEGVEAVRVRWIGHRLDASLHLTVNSSISVLDGHDIAEHVRHELFHKISKLDEVLVHVNPSGSDDHHEVTRHHDPSLILRDPDT